MERKPRALPPEYIMPGETPRLGQDYIMPRPVKPEDESAARPFTTAPSDNLEIKPDDVEGLGRATDDFWPGIEMDQTQFPAYGHKLDIGYKTRVPRRHPGLQNIAGDIKDFKEEDVKHLTDPKLDTAIDYARSMVGKTPSDKDLRDYLRGTLDPRKHDWCTAFLNATLRKAGVAGTPSMMASSFLAWGRHVDPKDVRAGDVIVTGEDDEGPRPGGLGHAAIVIGPVHKGEGRQSESDYAPTISGNWSHRVKASDVLADMGTAEFRRALPSHRARVGILHVHTRALVN